MYDDVYFCELIPAAEMAWADGTVQPNERAVLEAYAEELVAKLNAEAGGTVFTLLRAKRFLARVLSRRLRPYERQAALRKLVERAEHSPGGAAMKQRIVEWTEAVAAVDGVPVWDTRELFWLQTVKRTLGIGVPPVG